ncbi:hypothetical protein CATMQ487_09220 [Sphaerotilus microaerophilus]|uniref:Uncharacterized protein n=1 Tax=Sphaerotilus microaerophilus TaxID=2914710 RepID=A0ABN6PGW8_9BURK|nr:hypothetical protein CATMQ487_09220 [Sphaerotilus sp. FB-5]
MWTDAGGVGKLNQEIKKNLTRWRRDKQDGRARADFDSIHPEDAGATRWLGRASCPRVRRAL